MPGRTVRTGRPTEAVDGRAWIGVGIGRLGQDFDGRGFGARSSFRVRGQANAVQIF